MKEFHYKKLKPYIEKLSGIYTIELLYNQKYNAISGHYNSIRIFLKSNCETWDFEHELTHLKFLTENKEFKYLYPVKELLDDKFRLDLSNELCNIIQDMYVDTYLYFNDLAPLKYFALKIKVFERYCDNLEIHLKWPSQYISVIRECLNEYIIALKNIVNQSNDALEYLKSNSITVQENHIISYLSKMNEEKNFEWVTLKELHYIINMV